MLPLLALLVGCTLPGHGDPRERQSSRSWFDGFDKTHHDGAHLTAVEPPSYDPTKLGDAPSTLEPDDGIGSTPASFSVTGDGAAAYSVPIALPPGRAGLEPSIALTYNSDAGNGPVGVGFSLAGFSAISRCRSNLRDEGKTQGVRLTLDDRFCLDGVRLAAVSGTYGADGTEYRTVPDTFVKVVSHGGVNDAAGYTGPLSFTVYAKSGLIFDYGTDLNSTVSTGGVVEKWSVTNARDRVGNSMKYSYQASAASVDGVAYVWEQYPFDITYTAHANGTPADRRVAFAFENRPDHYESYEHGFKRFLSKRLRRVEVTGPGGELVRRYELSYTNGGAGGRSKLAELTECATLACKRPTRFRWAEGRPGFEGVWSTGVPSPPDGMEQLTIMDVDGDGRDDVVYPDDERWHIVYGGGPERPEGLVKHLATSARTDAPQLGKWQRGLPFDYNLDGRTDLLLADQSPEWRVLVSTGTDFTLVNTGVPRSLRRFEIVSTPAPSTDLLNDGIGVVDNATVGTFLADLDGDGVTDLIDRELFFDGPNSLCFTTPEACGGAWFFYRHTSTGFDPPVEITPLLGVSVGASIVPIDVDGDGKDEILFNGCSRHTLYDLPACPLGTRQPFRIVRLDQAGFEVVESGVPASLDEELLKPVDVNGDGLNDLVASNITGEFAPVYQPTLWLNTGRGFTFAGAAVNGPIDGPGEGRFLIDRGNLSLAVAVDDDGDGREDLLVPNSDPPNDPNPSYSEIQKFWLLGARDGHFTLEDPGLPYDHLRFEDTGKWYFSTRQGPKVADIDGDGRQDMVFISNGTFEWYLHRTPTSGHTKADVLTAVYEGSADFDPHPTPLDPAPDPLGTPTHRLFYAPLVEAYGVRVINGGQNPLDVYRSDLGADPCVYPCARFVGPRYVVSHHIDDTSAEPGSAQGGPARFTFYAYDEARVDRLGRGWLGFRARTSKEFFNDELISDGPPDARSRRGRWQRTIYDNTRFDAPTQTFPFAGHPALQLTYGYEPCDGGTCRWLNLDETSWGVMRPAGGATHFAYSQGGVHEEYERMPVGGELWSQALGRGDLFPPGPPPATVRSSSHTVEVDDYGNPTRVRTRNGPGFPGDSMGVNETVVDTIYPPNEAEWLVAHPTRQTVTDTVAAGRAERTAETVYDPHTGLPLLVLFASPHDPEHFLTINMERDAFGNVRHQSVSDAFGNVRDEAFTYEPDGIFLHAHRNALGHTTYVKAHPLFGAPAVAVDENGLRSTWQYDRFALLRAETAPDGSGATHWLTRERQGEAFLLEAHALSAGGGRTSVRFDRLGRPIRQVTRALGGQDLEVTRRYWGFGATRLETLSARVGEASPGQTEYDYDSRRRPLLTTLPEGTSIGYRYEGRTTFTRNPRGFEGYVTTNDRGQIIESADNSQLGASRRFRYGPFGVLVRSEVGVPLSDAPGEHPTTYVVDPYGRVRETTDPERGRRSMTYTPFGELVTEEDALDRLRVYEHDALGRRTLESVFRQGGSKLEAQTSYQYDIGEGKSLGQLTRVAFIDVENGASHQLVYRRDALGRVAKLDNVLPDPDTGAAERLRLTFGYDSVGRLGSVKYPALPGQGSAYEVEYRYDPFDQLRAAVEVGSGLELWAAEAVDQAGRLTRERFGNGTRTEPLYDPVRGLLRGSATYAPDAQGGAIVHAIGYGYDANGNVERRDQNDGLHGLQAETFTYDGLDRLLSGTREGVPGSRYSYLYDRLGNLTFKSGVGDYTYEPTRPQVLATAGGLAYGHDAVGNQVTRPGGVALAYNAFNLPTRITQGAVERATFAYDGLGRRVRKTTEQGVDTYAADLYERRQRPDGSVRHTMRVRAGDRPVAEVSFEVAPGGAMTSTKRYLHPDRLGSPYLVTDDAGSVAERRSYDPFGAPRHPNWSFDSPPPGPVQTEVGFTGHDDDEGLGLVNMKGRVYDPQLARFLTPDPTVQAPLVSASWNRYSYVWNNPLVFTDPTGFQLGQEAPYSNDALLQRLEAEDRSKPGFDPSSASNAAPAAGEKPSQQASPAGHRASTTNGPVGPGDAAARQAHDVEIAADAERGHNLVKGLQTMQRATMQAGAVVVGVLAGVELVGLGAEGLMGLAARAPGAVQAINNLIAGAIEGVAPGALGGGLTPALAGAGATAVGAGERALGQAEGLGGRVLGKLGDLTKSFAKAIGAGGRTGAKRGPKTDPAEPHNATIRAVGDKLAAQGNKILAGGGRSKERRFATPGGVKKFRRPDVLYETPSGEVRGVNVGRTMADGSPVPREVDALNDLNDIAGIPTDFVPYDRLLSVADIDIQFHALPEELALLLPPIANETKVSIAVLEAFPFNVRPISAPELERNILDKSVDRVAFAAVQLVHDSGIDDGRFFDDNPELLVLDIGRPTESGLKESRLSARLLRDSCARPLWLRFVGALRGITSTGAIAVNPRTGATSQLRTHRFTKGAKKLESNGVAMLPVAGTVRIQLSDFRPSAPSSKRPPISLGAPTRGCRGRQP